MKNTIVLLLLLVAPRASECQGLDEVREQLESLFHQSIKLRSQVLPTLQNFGESSPQMDSLNRSISSFDSTSLMEVEQILQTHGWLGSSKIGPLANHSIYLVIQHARKPQIRARYFSLLQASAEQGESDLSDMATMHDRILIESGKPQLYGTQYKMVNGQQEYLPIEDPKNVNKRRKLVGLSKISLKK